MKHLILTGFMGSGKTTVGSLLAEQLRLKFVDLDDAIAKETGLAPRLYIPRFGEKAFRKIETICLKKILESSAPVVLAAGGGAVLDLKNRQRMLKKGFVVWLKSPLTLILKRVGDGKGRPLLSKPVSLKSLRRLYSERKPFYQKCHFSIANAFQPAKTVANFILERYRNG